MNVTAVFTPRVKELFPLDFQTSVSNDILSTKLEGKTRSGHFTGVQTVVLKLFQIVLPQNAYLGQKDIQQVIILKRMVTDLNIPVKIITCRTIREKNGLALSSRNIYLTNSQRKEAHVLYQSLLCAQGLIKEGELKSNVIKNQMHMIIRNTSGIIDYISIADPTSLQEVPSIKKKDIISLAIRFGNTRLIDNIIVR
jgi:pantoate--beta-alanine ligase